MNDTINYYNQHAGEYSESTLYADMNEHYSKFLSYMQEGSAILDAGCGSGRDSKYFLEHGYTVTAMDASKEMCREAEKNIGQKVLCLRFEELSFREEFDGIWACASLLHVPKSEMPAVLQKLYAALKENGILYASFKQGTEERTQGGRFFNDYKEESAAELFKEAGFEIAELYKTEDVRSNVPEQIWINILAKKNSKEQSL